MTDIIRKRKFKKTKDVDRIEGNNIFLDGQGGFPKTVNVWFPKGMKEYRLLKSKADGIHLVKPN